MRTLWVCDGCDTYRPCYIVSDGENNPCVPCGRGEIEHITKARNVKLTYDIEELNHKEIK